MVSPLWQKMKANSREEPSCAARNDSEIAIRHWDLVLVAHVGRYQYPFKMAPEYRASGALQPVSENMNDGDHSGSVPWTLQQRGHIKTGVADP